MNGEKTVEQLCDTVQLPRPQLTSNVACFLRPTLQDELGVGTRESGRQLKLPRPLHFQQIKRYRPEEKDKISPLVQQHRVRPFLPLSKQDRRAKLPTLPNGDR